MTTAIKHRLVMAAVVGLVVTPAAARDRVHHRRHAVRMVPRPTVAEAQPSQPPLDDFYRRRGYGIGGPVFGADTDLAGACAGLRFAEPASCGRGYNIYGNGLGTRFGF